MQIVHQDEDEKYLSKMKDLESRNLSYTIVREFLANLESEFSEGDDKIIKVAELKKVK